MVFKGSAPLNLESQAIQGISVRSKGAYPLKTRLARDYEIGSNTGRRIGPQGSDGGFQPADPGDHRGRKYRTESFNLIR